jgi:hypothetical protein
VRAGVAVATSEAQANFDVCWEAYKACKDMGGISAIDASSLKEQRWKPAKKSKAEDFMADFALAGHAALKKDAASRRILFDIYYLGLGPYDRVREFLGLTEMGWVRWTEEIRQTVGRELERRGVVPLHRYFGE